MGFISNIRDPIEWRKVDDFYQIRIYSASNAFPSMKHLIGKEDELKSFRIT